MEFSSDQSLPDYKKIHQSSKFIEDVSLKDFAIESSINAIAFGDLEGNIIYVNEACLRMWGGEDRSEMLGRRIDFFTRWQQESFEVFQIVFSQGSWEGEIEGIKKDGSLATVYLSAFLVRNESNDPICTMCSFMDITEKKQIEEEMRLKDFAIESSINSIALGDLKGNITYVNRAFLQMWGGEEAEILGESVHNLVPPENNVEDIISNILFHGSWFGEVTARNKQGKLLHLQVSAALILDKQQNPLSLICSFVDISERKKAEEELNKAKEDLEIKVAERTESLVEANEQLKKEIEERKQIEEQLREKENELQQKADHFEEVNTALKVLLKRREEDKEELEEKVVSNVKELIMPYIEELSDTNLDSKQRSFLNVIASNLENIVSPFAKNLTSRNLDFTPTQLQIAELIKSGKSTKDIAEIMETTDRAVEFHRNNIRDKLGLKHKKINLRTYLLSYS